LACGKLKVAPGEVRLVATMTERPEGMKVRPEAAQVNAATLLLVHLKHSELPPPERDFNLKLDIKMPEIPDPVDPTDIDAPANNAPDAAKTP
jgi:hypothetical protein